MIIERFYFIKKKKNPYGRGDILSYLQCFFNFLRLGLCICKKEFRLEPFSYLTMPMPISEYFLTYSFSILDPEVFRGHPVVGQIVVVNQLAVHRPTPAVHVELDGPVPVPSTRTDQEIPVLIVQIRADHVLDRIAETEKGIENDREAFLIVVVKRTVTLHVQVVQDLDLFQFHVAKVLLVF